MKYLNKKLKQINLFKIKSTYDFDTNSFIYKGQHYDHIGMPILMPITRDINRFYGVGLAEQLQRTYEDTPIEYQDPIFTPRSYFKSTIFTLGGKVKSKRNKFKIQTIHRISIGTMEVELDDNVIRINGATSVIVSDAKDLVKALNRLIILSKEPQVRLKVVKRRKRRKNVR